MMNNLYSFNTDHELDRMVMNASNQRKMNYNL